jgi:hypothetical protein
LLLKQPYLQASQLLGLAMRFSLFALLLAVASAAQAEQQRA